ncbi:hypothetical protein L1987_80297 [Smallanthus sonchifolius]|uniref:Uncharacterized protein n=1 Tax=Smallanthus sonchifolius TaxID=185202 RepID=A0ACB8YLM3_9ASTR|nr:hypothetical protein L1987_80297 [Smallanthus sonchifolius]
MTKPPILNESHLISETQVKRAKWIGASSKQVAITVRYDIDDASSVSEAHRQRTLCYALLMFRSLAICVIAWFRIHFANESALENNKVFSMSSLVSSCVVAIVFTVLLLEHSPRIGEDGYYTMWKFIGSFSAFLAPFSLLMVILLPPGFNWIGYLLACVIFGIVAKCFSFNDLQGHRPSIFDDLAQGFIFLLAFPSFFFPNTSVNWIMYPLIYVCLWMENAYHFTTCLMLIYKNTRNPEAYQLTQQDENNTHPQLHLSYLMPLGSSSL